MDSPAKLIRLPKLGLAAKLAGCLVAVAVLFLALFGYTQQRLQQRQLEALVSLSAERISDILRSATWQQMLRNDRSQLYETMKDLAKEPGIRRMRIFSKEGRIAQSTDESEIGMLVDKSAEACYACHAQERPLERLARKDRARIFTRPDGKRTLAVIKPIENHPDCSSASCHVHPADQRILGVIDAHLALDAVDLQLAEHRAQVYASFAGAAVLLSLFSAGFVWLVVHRPVRELMQGTVTLARGDLSHRLDVHSSDELGSLAQSFNQMAHELDEAHGELTSWARTLEVRVQTKTGELERAQRSLIASEKMASLGRLAATVAHEVNNPLFGMLTYARLTRKDVAKIQEVDPALRERILEHLAIIERESRRCGDLMKTLLAFSRQSAPQRAQMNIETIIGRAVELVTHQARLAEIELTTVIEPGIPDILGDAAQLQQVFLALLVNAIDAIGRDGAITISAGLDSGRDAVEVRIRDTGSGIPEEIQSQIFEPFFSTKENQHRTGLGLAIAHSIVERHGGALSVRSQPGQGAEFTIKLPLTAPQDLVPAAAAPQLAPITQEIS